MDNPGPVESEHDLWVLLTWQMLLPMPRHTKQHLILMKGFLYKGQREHPSTRETRTQGIFLRLHFPRRRATIMNMTTIRRIVNEE